MNSNLIKPVVRGERALGVLSSNDFQLASREEQLRPGMSLPCTEGGYTACPGRGFHMVSLAPPLPPTGIKQLVQAISQGTKGDVLVVKSGMSTELIVRPSFLSWLS